MIIYMASSQYMIFSTQNLRILNILTSYEGEFFCSVQEHLFMTSEKSNAFVMRFSYLDQKRGGTKSPLVLNPLKA